MQSSYRRIGTTSGPAFVKAGATDAISGADSIVFDCDGVLIDTSRSYDRTISATVDTLFGWMFGVSLPWRGVAATLIHRLRRTGGFNNDWDTAYAMTLFGACSLPPKYAAKLQAGPPTRQPRAVRVPRAESARVFTLIQRVVSLFEGSMEGVGHESVSEFVRRSLPPNKRELCDRVGKYVGYPGNPPSSMLASLFDETYHGEQLYKEMYDVEPRYFRGRGFIKDDKLIVRPTDLGSLSETVGGRLALATGRPRQAAEYSLGELMSYFDLDACVFIGDGDVHPTPEVDEFRKPSGKSLLWAQKKLGSRRLVYVGDSAEDSQMAANARKSSSGIAFAGIYATSYDPADQLRLFKREGAELILPTVRVMPSIMRGIATR